MATMYLDLSGLQLYDSKVKAWANATFAPISHTHGNISNDGKLTGKSAVVITNADGVITTDANISVTELGYLNNATSNIQSQIDVINTAIKTGGISANAASATKLQTSRTIDGVSFDGTADITHFATCSTVAADATKEVALTGFTLAAGAEITVKFATTNTANDPKLKVGTTDAKPIVFRGSAISAGHLQANNIYRFVFDGTNYEVVGDGFTASDGIKIDGSVIKHTNSVTATTDVGGKTTASVGFGGTITVPYFSYDAQGHITASGSKTITLPASDNVDEKVVQSVSTENSDIPVILKKASTSGSSDGVYYDSGVTINPSNHTVKATTFTGALSGNASTATKLATGRTVTIKDADNTNSGTASTAFDGSSNLTVNLPSTIKATLSGNATTATSVDWNNGAGITNHPTSLSGYGITDAYTKTEIDSKLTSAMKYKGSVNYYSILSNTAVSNGKTTITIGGSAVELSTGDFYNVLYEGTSGTVEDGSNYAWTGTTWDKVGFAVNFPAISNSAIEDLFKDKTTTS